MHLYVCMCISGYIRNSTTDLINLPLLVLQIPWQLHEIRVTATRKGCICQLPNLKRTQTHEHFYS